MKQVSNEFVVELKKNQFWLQASGLLLCIIGLGILVINFLPISFPRIYLFINLFIVSIILFIHAFRFWYKKSTGFMIYLVAGLFYLFMSVFFLKSFMLRLFLPMLVILLLFIFGYFKIYAGFSQLFIRVGWACTILAGVVDLALSLLGIYYFSMITGASLIILALGLDVLFTGISFVALGFLA